MKHEADINKESKYGDTPFIEACRNRNENIIKWLEEHGVDKDATKSKIQVFNYINEIKKLIKESHGHISKKSRN